MALISTSSRRRCLFVRVFLVNPSNGISNHMVPTYQKVPETWCKHLHHLAASNCHGAACYNASLTLCGSKDAMELHKLAFPERPQPSLVDEEVRVRVGEGRSRSQFIFVHLCSYSCRGLWTRGFTLNFCRWKNWMTLGSITSGPSMRPKST